MAVPARNRADICAATADGLSELSRTLAEAGKALSTVDSYYLRGQGGSHFVLKAAAALERGQEAAEQLNRLSLEVHARDLQPRPKSLRFVALPKHFVRWMQEQRIQYTLTPAEDAVEVHVDQQARFKHAKYWLERFYCKIQGRYRFCPADEDLWNWLTDASDRKKARMHNQQSRDQPPNQ